LDYWFFSQSTTVPGHYITSLAWEFGDGTTLEDCCRWDVTHAFDEEKIYQVTLTVTDDRGVSATVTKDVSVMEVAAIGEWRLTLGWPVQITGEVANRYSETLHTVTIKAKFYNVDGVRLTEGTVDVSELEPGERARFTITAVEYSSEISYATVFVESFITDCPGAPYFPKPVADGVR
jgi:PKD repeat protein